MIKLTKKEEDIIVKFLGDAEYNCAAEYECGDRDKEADDTNDNTTYAISIIRDKLLGE